MIQCKSQQSQQVGLCMGRGWGMLKSWSWVLELERDEEGVCPRVLVAGEGGGCKYWSGGGYQSTSRMRRRSTWCRVTELEFCGTRLELEATGRTYWRDIYDLFVWMYIHSCKYIFPIFDQWKGLETLTFQEATISSFPNTIKRTEILGEMANTRSITEKVHEEPRMPGCTRKLKSAQRIMKTCQKNT